MEFGDGPDDGEALQFSGGVCFLRLVKGARGTTNDALLASLYLSEDSSDACGGGIGVQLEWEVKVREGSNGAGGEEGFEAIEGFLTLWTPVEDRIFPGEGVERAHDSDEIIDISPVVPGEAQKRANFRCSLGGSISQMATNRIGSGRRPSEVTR